MLQQENPDDFVIAIGITTSVREFFKMAFSEIGVELEFKGSKGNETAIVKSSSNPEYKTKVGQLVLEINKIYYRLTVVDLLVGNSQKAKEKLECVPKHTLTDMIKDMIQLDLQLFKKDESLKKGRFGIKTVF